MRVLVIEDEQGLREGLVDLLRADGHEVSAASDGASGVELGLREPFDLVVLDLMLPRIGGLDVCRRLRAARPALAILVLTALGAEDDVVRGFGDGADDYVAKPFSPRALLARVRALGRRARSDGAECLKIDGCRLDLGRLEAVRDGRSVELTAREVGIVRLLHRCRERAVSRAELLECVWASRGDLETRAVDMAISVLRKKIERDPRTPRIVCSVKGVGYAWGSEVT